MKPFATIPVSDLASASAIVTSAMRQPAAPPTRPGSTTSSRPRLNRSSESIGSTLENALLRRPPGFEKTDVAIPVENVYYLLCHAWDHLEALETVPRGVEKIDPSANLLAHVLSRGVARLLKQGLDHGYVTEKVELAGLRGKLCLDDTVKRLLLVRGRTTCEVDELTTDVPHNRILKAAKIGRASCRERV